MSFDIGILNTQIQIGRVYLELDDLETSELYFLRALETAKSNSRFFVTGHYFLVFLFSDLINFFLNRNKPKKAEEIYQLLIELSNECNTELVHHYLKYAKVTLLKSSKKFKNFVEAQDILRKLIQEEASFEFLFKISIRLLLCELLLLELEFSEDKEIWIEIEELINNAEKIIGDRNLLFLVSILQIKAQFALISHDVRKSIQLLDEAQDLSEKMGLKVKIRQISEQKDEIIEEGSSKISPKKIQTYIQDAMKYVNEWKSTK